MRPLPVLEKRRAWTCEWCCSANRGRCDTSGSALCYSVWLGHVLWAFANPVLENSKAP